MSIFDTPFDSEPETAAPSLASLARQVWKRRALVLLVIVVTLFTAVLVSVLAPKTYRASADVKVSSGNLQSANGVSSAEASTLLGTQVQVLLSTQLASEVAQRVGDEVEIIDVSVEGVPESQIATVSVEADSAEGAAEAANAYVLAYDERRDRGAVEEAVKRGEIVQEQLDALQLQLDDLSAQVAAEAAVVNGEQARITIARDAAARAGTVLDPADVVQPNTAVLTALQARYTEAASQVALLRTQLQGYEQDARIGDGGVAIVSTATPPSAPENAGLVQVLLLAGLLGLALGIGLAVLLSLVGRRLAGRDDVARAARGVPVYGPVHRTSPGADVSLDVDGLILPSLHAASADSYRVVAAQLSSLTRRRSIDRLLVAAATDGDAQPAAAGGLAVALATLGKTVVVIDGDVRGHAPDDLDPGRRAGLTDVLTGDALLADALAEIDVPGDGTLRVLSSGRGGVDPAVVLASSAMGQLIDRLSAEVDVVIVAGSPLLSTGDALVVLSHIESVVLSVTLEVTKSTQVSDSATRVGGVGGRLVGIVLHDQHRAPNTPAPRRAGRTEKRTSPDPVVAARD